jgi:hypothetical protein
MTWVAVGTAAAIGATVGAGSAIVQGKEGDEILEGALIGGATGALTGGAGAALGSSATSTIGTELGKEVAQEAVKEGASQVAQEAVKEGATQTLVEAAPQAIQETAVNPQGILQASAPPPPATTPTPAGIEQAAQPSIQTASGPATSDVASYQADQAIVDMVKNYQGGPQPELSAEVLQASGNYQAPQTYADMPTHSEAFSAKDSLGPVDQPELLNRPDLVSQETNPFLQGVKDVGSWMNENKGYTAAGAYLGLQQLGAFNQKQGAGVAPEPRKFNNPYRLSPNFKGGPYSEPNVYKPKYAAQGGIMQSYQAGGPVERMSMANTAMNPQGGLYPQGMIDKTQYAVPIQRPVSSELVMDTPGYERSNPMLMASGGQVKGYAAGGQIDMGNGYNPFANLPPMSGPLGAVGQAPAGGFNPFSPERMTALNNDPQFREHMRVQGGGYDEQGRTVDGLGNVIERTAPSGQSFGQIMGTTYVNPFKSMMDDPVKRQQVMDYQRSLTSQPGYAEFYNQQTAATQQAIAQPTGQSTFPGAASMQGGFGQGASGYPSFTMGSGGGGGSGGPFPLEGQYGIVKMASGGVARFANEGEVEERPSRRYRGDLMGTLDKYNEMIEGRKSGSLPSGRADPYTGVVGTFEDSDVDTRLQNADVAAMTRLKKAGKRANVGIAAIPMGVQAGVLNLPTNAAGGGIMQANLGSYAAGGNPRLLRGPGDGMSDNIPATIGGKQPARLADGEFVVPADVVSHLGNGSTDAGAKKLHAMMDKVRMDRTGRKKQAPAVKAKKYIPK